MGERRYYWLKLKDDFFSSIRIKKLRKLAGGDTYTIIYLKMQLKAMKNDGYLHYSGLEESIAEEIALDIDEDTENVKVTLSYLQSCGLMETYGPDCYLPYAVENVGSESSSAKRVRDCRERKALQCNTDVTEMKRSCNVDIEKEKDIDIDKRVVVGDTTTPPQPDDMNEIVASWNEIPHTLNVKDVIPTTARWNELQICLSMYGKDRILEAIRHVKESAYLKRKGRVAFDHYINRNAVQKLLEGAYDHDFQVKPSADSFEEQLKEWANEQG